MRSFPSGWNTMLAKLGFVKAKPRKCRQRDKYSRSLRFESLECRQMLATVTTLLDVNDPNDGVTTLREAIAVTTAGGIVDFASSLSGGTITLDRVNLGQISFGKSLTIDASALSGGIIIDADDPTPGRTGHGIRIFNITDASGGSAPPLVTLVGLTFTGSDVPTNASGGQGGAIRSQVRLIVRDCVFVGNESLTGGAIFSEVAGGGATVREVLRIENSVIEGNDASNGAGVAVVSGNGSFGTPDTILITGTTISDNWATSFGGGVHATLYGADVTITDSTLELNEAGSDGRVASGKRVLVSLRHGSGDKVLALAA